MSKNIVAVLLVGSFLTSRSAAQSGIIQVDNPAAANRVQQTADDLDEPLAAALLQILQEEYRIHKPFAWAASAPRRGRVFGIDTEGQLREFTFAETSNGYSVTAVDALGRWNKLVAKSGELLLRDYVSSLEFPFRSETISTQRCRAHFVLIWRAVNRSLRKTYEIITLDLRVIVEKDGMVVSNKLEGFVMVPGLRDAFAVDVNGDHSNDFVLIDRGNYDHVRIWEVGDDCTVKSIRFKENGDISVSLPGREVFLRRDASGPGFTVHAVMPDFGFDNQGNRRFRMTESVFRWDKEEGLYKLSKTRSRPWD